MYELILPIHSLLRYAVFLMVVFVSIKSLLGWLNKSPYTKADDKLALFAMIATHLQLTIGVILYFISPNVDFSHFGEAMKDPVRRFWLVEHNTMMVAAILLITLGRTMSKKAPEEAKHRKAAIFFGIALLILLYAVPWPFSKVPRPWF